MRDPLVLCYHGVSPDWGADISIPPERLEAQLRTLVRRGYRGATFTEALVDPPAEKTLVVTFDDALCSVLERAAPILERLGLPGTLFVPTAMVGDDRPRAAWSGITQWLETQHAAELELMSWDQIVSLSEAGWEIGAHARTHPRLPDLDAAALETELRGSRQDVEARLARPCSSLAYPYGAVDDRVVNATAEAGFAAAAGLPHPLHGPARLNWPRVGIHHGDGRVRFELKASRTVQRVRARGHMAAAVTDPPVVASNVTGQPAPRVVVLIPCFNDGLLVREALASIREAEPVEMVVIDDASTEESTAAALDELRASGVRILRHEHNRGLSAARMTGLAATTAPYVFPLDADDLLVAGALAQMADRLDDRGDVAACFADTIEFGTRDRVYRAPRRLDPYRVAYRNDYPVSSIFRRTVLEQVGGWQDVGGQVGYEDWNLWMTLAERGCVAIHAGPGMIAVRHRLHGQRMLSDAIQRHRALYAELRRTHPKLFSALAAHRRASDMHPLQRLLYPIAFGQRPPLGLRTSAERMVARLRRP